MFNLQYKRRNSYSQTDLLALDKVLDDYWDKSRTSESEKVIDLEKHLWLANGAAATMSIGFIQAKNIVSIWQYTGAWSFIIGIVLLVLMKYVSMWIVSRDRFRFQDAKSRFDSGEVSDEVFSDIRDCTFSILKGIYCILRFGAGATFIAGLILTLIGLQCLI